MRFVATARNAGLADSEVLDVVRGALLGVAKATPPVEAPVEEPVEEPAEAPGGSPHAVTPHA